MATLKHTQSRRMYSWWWDSHISPKNSKWLQDNLTDMDFKLKAMIKLIEEDADSFARRAEMYYKKRPELMKLIEEFYRAYRALAERYDHATVVIRQAHKTMTEAFPNQGDDSPNSVPEDDPSTPKNSTHPRSLFQNDETENGENTEESDFGSRIKGFKEGNRRVRKGLNFQDLESSAGEHHIFPDPEEILVLRKALAEVEAEKEAGLVQYQQSLDKLSKLESEISRAQEDSRQLSERASNSEAEVKNLKEAITKLEAQKDENLVQYHECLDKLSSLEDIISQTDLKDDLAKLTSEKDAALDQYVVSLEKISNLENRLQLAEEDARKSNERAEKAEREIETLTHEISKLSEEKEAAALQYQQSLNTVTLLENKLSTAREEAEKLRMEIDNGASKLKGAEEQCLVLERSNESLQAELESLMVKTSSQGEELTGKQKELGRLWTCVQEERLRFVEAETAFQTLQHLHGQAQEELHALASQLQNRVQILNDVKAHNRELQDEVLKIREENTGLNEMNVSSAMSMKNMQEEIITLRKAKGMLEEEVELRVDQRNALQQEIYCLKEELNDLNKNHLSVLEKVTELQDENSKERSEKKALLEKLEILAQLLEKNSVLENSLSDLSAELEAARGKINSLEESFRSLLEEKSVLLDEKTSLGSQLQATNDNLEKLSEKNTLLENSLSDTLDELQSFKEKSKDLEDSCELLANQNTGLAVEKDNLSHQLEITQLRMEELEKGIAEFQESYSLLEKDKASALCKIEELQISLDEEKQERATFSEMNETQLASMRSKMHSLQEECELRKREFDIELDKALHSEIEIFILQRSSRDLREANTSLLIKYEKLLELSTLSDTLISKLETEKTEQQNEAKSLSHQVSILRNGIFPLLKALNLVSDGPCQDTAEQDVLNLTSALRKIEETKQSFNKNEEENQQLGIEKMVLITLLQRLRVEAEGLEAERSAIEKELKNEAVKLHSVNEALVKDVGNLQRNLLVVQQALQDVLEENLKISEDKQSLTGEVVQLKENNCSLEEENYVMCDEMLSNVYLSMIFKYYIDDKTLEMRELGEHSDTIQEKLNATERKLEEVQIDNRSLGETLQKSEDQMKIVTESRDKLSHAIELAKNLLGEEREESKIYKENLQSELQKQMNEIEILETDASFLFGQLQTSNIYRLLYEQKIHELGEAIDSLRDASTVKDTDNKLLKERLSMLAAESEGLNVKLAAYTPVMTSLEECISSLENKISLLGKNQKLGNEELKGVEVADNLVSDAFLEFQNLLNRVRAIEKTVVELEMENSDVHSQLDAALWQIEELKNHSSLCKKHSTSEISEEENALLTKDIMLDQISESLPYGISELGVDKLAIPRNSTDQIQERNNTKILHRLNSDVQKLMNLHLMVQDLKKKLEITENSSRKGKTGVDECDTLKGQLEEAETTLLKLFALNGKLMKNIENGSFSSDKISSTMSGSARKRDISGQAQKMSERIGRVQLEIEQIQVVLLKLEGEKESKGKTAISEAKKRRVLLRDYLYGLGTNQAKRKKTLMCGCFQPSTTGE